MRGRPVRSSRLLAAAGALLLIPILAGSGLLAAEGTVPVGNLQPHPLPGISNLLRFSEKLYNGSMPEGEEGFRSLQRLGIRTIISVDGARPDVEAARKLGMRYVHLPFGYDGCPPPRAAQIVRAIRDLPGPIYIHCHHGRNRSPAGAAFARIALDRISHEEAVRELERAGTGREYTGLYRSVRTYRPPAAAELDRVPAAFPEVAATPRMTEAMVEIQQRFDRLSDPGTDPRKAGAAEPAHEALQLRELFTELLRTPELRSRPAQFQAEMRASERESLALEKALRSGDREGARRHLVRIDAQCRSCHTRFRDSSPGS